MKKYYTSFILLLWILSIQKVFAIAYSWTGAGADNLWTTVANWSPQGVPTAIDDVVIVSSSRIPTLVGNTTVRNFTISSGSLELSNYELNITGTALLTAGSINNGSLIITGASTIFGNNGLNGPVINATLNVTSASIGLNGGTFNGVTNLTKTGSSWDIGAGGNIFNALTILTNQGSGLFITGDNTNGIKDVFNADLELNNITSDGCIFLARRSQGNEFNGNITVNNTANNGSVNGSIAIGSLGGTSKLAAGKTISVGNSIGFKVGVLFLAGLTQEGSQAQVLHLTGSSVLRFEASNIFNGAVSFTAGSLRLTSAIFKSNVDISAGNIELTRNTFNGTTNCNATSVTFTYSTFHGLLNTTAGSIRLNGGVFNGVTNLIKTGAVIDIGYGGNTFNATTTITNKGGSLFITGDDVNGVKDVYNGDLFLNNSVSNSAIHLARRSKDNVFNGNVIINNKATNGVITFGLFGGTSKLAIGKSLSIDNNEFVGGTLTLSGLTQEGTQPQSLHIPGATLAIGPNTTFNGAVDFTAGGFQLNGGTFHGTTILSKVGSLNSHGVGGNVFNGETTINSTGSSGWLTMGESIRDIFKADLIINSTGGSHLYLNRAKAENLLEGHLKISSTGSGHIYFGDQGGTTNLKEGMTICVGSAGFSAGRLDIRGFSQAGDTPQSFTLTGTAQLSLGQGNSFGGKVNFTAPHIYVTKSSFAHESTFTKTGSGANGWAGGNVFKRKVNIINQAPAGSTINMALSVDDVIYQ